MISLVKRRFAALRHVTIDNSLFLYRLQRFSIYTWSNLATVFILIVMVYSTIARFAHYLEIRQRLAALPPEFREEQMNSFIFDDYILLFQTTGFSTFTSFNEFTLILKTMILLVRRRLFILKRIYVLTNPLNMKYKLN